MEELFLMSGAVCVLLFVAWRVFKMKILVVPEDARFIIYRLGRFHRLAGPGPILFCGRLENIAQVLDVRNQPHEFTLSHLRAFGLPFAYTMRIWYRVDPAEAAARDSNILRHVTLMRETDRYDELKAGLHELLMRGIDQLERRYAGTEAYSASRRLFILAPGQPGARALLDGLLPDLSDLLRAQGAILAPDKPVVLQQLHLIHTEADQLQPAMQAEGHLMEDEDRAFHRVPATVQANPEYSSVSPRHRPSHRRYSVMGEAPLVA